MANFIAPVVSRFTAVTCGFTCMWSALEGQRHKLSIKEKKSAMKASQGVRAVTVSRAEPPLIYFLGFREHRWQRICRDGTGPANTGCVWIQRLPAALLFNDSVFTPVVLQYVLRRNIIGLVTFQGSFSTLPKHNQPTAVINVTCWPATEMSTQLLLISAFTSVRSILSKRTKQNQNFKFLHIWFNHLVIPAPKKKKTKKKTSNNNSNNITLDNCFIALYIMATSAFFHVP